jgi:hypothetical protein
MDSWQAGNGAIGWQNTKPQSYVSWMWRRAPGFFDVVTYEGDAATPINHNLGVSPELIITKEFAHSWDWYVWGSVLGDNAYLSLNRSGGKTDYTFDTTVTDKTFVSGISSNNQPTIAYLFASVPGVCSIGSYTGAGGDQDIDCGFTNGARFVLIKRTDADGDWMVFDTSRGITDLTSPRMTLNKGGNDGGDSASLDYQASFIKPFSKGFTATPNLTGISNAEYIYMAIA